MASVGGTESVHADLLKAVSTPSDHVFIRYRINRWLGYDRLRRMRKEGSDDTQMLAVYSENAKVHFLSDKYEPKRLAYWVKPFYIGYLSTCINRARKPVLVFWHRESVQEIWPYLADHVSVVDIVHNSIDDEAKEDTYLNMDLAGRINVRVTVTGGLMARLEDKYAAAGREDLSARVRVIPHVVHLPETCDPLPGRHRVLFLGRDTMEKRFDLFGRIADRARDQGLPFEFVAIGPKPEDHPDLAGTVHMLGEVRDRERINVELGKSGIILLTSSSEGFPKAIAEAMAFGMVTISTDVGFVSDHVLQGETGFLISQREELLITQAMESLQSLLDESTYKQMSTASRKRARDVFAWRPFETAWKDLLSACRK